MSAISGVLIELAAIGNQDSYLNIRPRLTLFRGSYRRITNFAWCPLVETLSNVKENSIASVDLPRAGDLVAQVYVCMLLPSLIAPHVYDNGAGFAMVRNSTLEIGGYPFDSYSGRFMYMWNQLSTSDARKLGATVIQGSAQQVASWSAAAGTPGKYAGYATGQQLYVPLCFWFNRHYAQTLPMISLQYHAVKLSLEFNALSVVQQPGGFDPDVDQLVPGNKFQASVLINYIFLDTVERRLFAATPHEYLIDQVHSPDGNSGLAVTTTSYAYKPIINHPTKEVIFAFQKDSPSGYNNYEGGVNSAPGGSSDAFEDLAVSLNGNERVKGDATYFREVVPREVHTSAPYLPDTVEIFNGTSDVFRNSDQIYNYSFCLDPEDWKPSGSCNFSRVDTVTFKFDNIAFNAGQASSTLYFFYRNYNVMKIVAGMAGLRYAN